MRSTNYTKHLGDQKLINITMCVFCKHYVNNNGKRSCSAFPDGIPKSIMMGDVAHIKPLPGDNGIQFEPKDEEAAHLFSGYEYE